MLEKLAQLLTAKASETTSSQAIVTRVEPIPKVELMPSDIKLEGIRNYLSWSHCALLILKAKELEGFVEGN